MTTVATIATTGAIRAASGIVVGSVPVTIVGPKMLTAVAADQATIVVPEKSTPLGRLRASSRIRASTMSATAEAPRPHSHVEKAAIGSRCCSLPVIMSGENTLMSATAPQIVAKTASVHAVHESWNGAGGDA